jgi:glycosyltransferase involved in cell wall biosynthesis
MRVLFVTHNFPRWPGDAAGSFLLTLARALHEHGASVHVVAPAGAGASPSDDFDGVTVERVRYAPRRLETLAYTGTMAAQVRTGLGAMGALAGLLATQWRATAAAVRRHRPDVVHAHWWFPAGVVCRLASGGRPLIVTMHGSDVRLAAQATASHAVLRDVLAFARASTTVSHWLADQVVALGARRPVVAPMPVRTELFAPGGARTDGRILFVGRLAPQKGIATLLEALALLPPPATLDVVGEGPDRASLEARGRALGVGGRIRWLGHLLQPELVPLYREASVVAVPSRDEGLGLVAVEAQLCSAPVVAADSGGLPDVVQHGRTGLLVPPDDVPALAAALTRVLGDPALAGALGDAGRSAALERFAPHAVARRYLALYEEARAAAVA